MEFIANKVFVLRGRRSRLGKLTVALSLQRNKDGIKDTSLEWIIIRLVSKNRKVTRKEQNEWEKCKNHSHG